MGARFLIAAIAGGAVLLGQTPSMAVTGDDATALSGLTVMARRPLSGIEVNAKQCLTALDPADAERKPPKLVSSYPRDGANVRPGVVIIRLTFDQPMTCDGTLQRERQWLYPCPVPLRSPMMSRDRRTFLTVCKLDASTGYGLVLDGFTSLAGHPLKSTRLEFSANPLAEIKTIEEAIQQDPELRNPKPVRQ